MAIVSVLVHCMHAPAVVGETFESSASFSWRSILRGAEGNLLKSMETGRVTSNHALC